MRSRRETQAFFAARGYAFTRARFRWPKEYHSPQYRKVIRLARADRRKGYGPATASQRLLPKRERLSKGWRKHLRRMKAGL